MFGDYYLLVIKKINVFNAWDKRRLLYLNQHETQVCQAQKMQWSHREADIVECQTLWNSFANLLMGIGKYESILWLPTYCFALEHGSSELHDVLFKYVKKKIIGEAIIKL